LAQDVAVKDTDLSAILVRLSSERRADRATAFYDFIDLGAQASDNHAWATEQSVQRVLAAAPAQASAVRTALIALLNREDDAASPADARYETDLIGAVAALRDARALAALMRHVGTDDVAERGVAALGTPAVAAAVDAAHRPDPLVRTGAAHILGEMLRLQGTGALDSPNRSTVTALLKDLAAHDEFSRLSADGKRRVYPVREAASAALSGRSLD
jgi:hypothetical protein